MMEIDQSFLPIVTTYSVTSSAVPLAACLNDPSALSAAFLEHRAKVKDTLPRGCNLAVLSAIIHQNSPEENLAFFRKIHEALEPGGTLLIRDFVMDSTRTMPKEGALFALNMLVNTVAGDTYTFDDLSEALGQVGFVHIELSRGQDLQSDVVKAEKSSR